MCSCMDETHFIVSLTLFSGDDGEKNEFNDYLHIVQLQINKYHYYYSQLFSPVILFIYHSIELCRRRIFASQFKNKINYNHELLST